MFPQTFYFGTKEELDVPKAKSTYKQKKEKKRKKKKCDIYLIEPINTLLVSSKVSSYYTI